MSRMQITYTAQELYEHIRSFDFIEFFGNQNEHNVSMIVNKTSCVSFYKGKKYCHIDVELHYGEDSELSTCSWGISGNVFTCEGVKTEGSEFFTLVSDCGDKPVEIMLKKFHSASCCKYCKVMQRTV